MSYRRIKPLDVAVFGSILRVMVDDPEATAARIRAALVAMIEAEERKAA